MMGFGKGKYKKIITSIYPTTPDGEVQVHNIGKLVHFCQISPTKLIKVARYVERKANSDLTKSKLKFVGASMKIFQDLIKGCRKNLNLFSTSVLKLMKTLLEGSFPELKILATETFIQFTEVLDESTPYPELETLIPYFIDMCQNQIRDRRTQIILKQDGLRGIRSYIQVLEMNDELDGFIARYSDNENWAVLLPAILENLTFVPSGPDGASPAEDNRGSVQELATEVLRDIFSRTNISVTSLFKAIVRYLDAKNKWVPNAFAVLCVQSVYDCLKVQHVQILITMLLQHAEQSHHTVIVKAQIYLTLVQFFTESTGYFMQILDSLIKNLVSSVEYTSQDQNVNDNASHLQFQDTILACLGTLCAKISHAQRLEAFNAVCARLSQSKHINSTGLSGVIVVFARAILQIITFLQTFSTDILMPYLRLLRDLSMHNNNDVRLLVQRIFQCILLPEGIKKLEQMILSPRKVVNPNTEDLGADQLTTTVRSTLYHQTKIRGNQPENYVVVFETLRLMLFRGGIPDLIESFPLIFSIQKFASKWKKIPPSRAYTIHMMVAAYLYCAAIVLQCKALEAYVAQVLQEREKKGQLCSIISFQKQPIPSLLYSAQQNYGPPQKKAQVEYLLFDRQLIVDMVCQDDASVISTDKRFSKLLLKKYKYQSDTLTLTLIYSDSSFFFAPNSPVSTIEPNTLDIALQPSGHLPPTILTAETETKSSPIADERLLHKIDIGTMKRTLVNKEGPVKRNILQSSTVVQYRHIASFDTVASRSEQKTQEDRQIQVLVSRLSHKVNPANHNDKGRDFSPKPFNIFEFDLLSALQNQ